MLIAAQIRGSLLAIAMVIPSQALHGEGVETLRAAPRTGEEKVQTTNTRLGVAGKPVAGSFALATQVDDDLVRLGAGLQGGNGTAAYNAAVIGGDGTTTFTDGADNSSDILDAGIRAMVQTLDDANIPQRDRVMVIPPVAKKDMLGINRFTEQAFVGEVGMSNSIRNGRIGNIYGMEVFVSTNCDTTTTAGARIGLMMHKSAFALVLQLDIRVQTDYQLDYLADLLVADTLYGVGELRNDGGVAFAVPAT